MSGKPMGVLILFLIQLISALFWIISGVLVVMALGIFGAIFGLISLIVGIILLIIAFGLYGLKSWAWMWALIFNIIGLIAGLLGDLTSLTNLIGIVLSAIVVIYLLLPDIRSRFR